MDRDASDGRYPLPGSRVACKKNKDMEEEMNKRIMGGEALTGEDAEQLYRELSIFFNDFRYRIIRA
ncbi:hypothetical protein HID58_065807 [Brassica napus]|uniref:Uncharacterized protein n=1 Tax=Brassica napus TaxID=3708 RepID=A0ABQ7ZE56_BRANA|nr:hypothetical protein HID58_065807 [Brassica napus]